MQYINTYEKILETYGYKPSPVDTEIQDETISFLYVKGDEFVWIEVNKNSAEIERIFVSCSLFWTNESDYGTSGIMLYKDPDEYEKYGLELFEETMKVVDNPLLQELKIAEAHAKNIRWTYETLWPILKSFGYKTKGVGIIDKEIPEDDGEFNLYFEKIEDDIFRENCVWVSTDRFTGKLEVQLGKLRRNLAWENSETLKTLIEEYVREKNNSN